MLVRRGRCVVAKKTDEGEGCWGTYSMDDAFRHIHLPPFTVCEFGILSRYSALSITP